MSKLSLGVERAAQTQALVAMPPILPTSRARLTDNAVAFPDDFNASEWEQFGHAVGRMGVAKMWWLGDWYATGKRYGWGRLADAERITGEKRSTINAAYWVASKVVTRVIPLTWDHHRIVAKMDAEAQAHWLARAVAEKLTTRQLKDVIRKASARERVAEVPEGEDFRVVVGDFRTAEIADESVDWIITDPPYPAEFLPLYGDLSAFAARVLRPGGSLVAMVGQSYLPAIVAALGECLTYQWTLSYLTPGGQAVQLWDRKVNTFWKPLLWYVKGEYTGKWIGDVAKSNVNDNDKRFHGWGQSESGMADIIERFTDVGELILDPFGGGMTTGIVAQALGRRFIGIEIDPVLLPEASDGAA